MDTVPFIAWPKRTSDRALNFNAGPGPLPLPCLEQAQKEMLNFQGSGMSIMEMSHRSKTFMKVYQKAVDNLKEILSIPDTHSVIFMQGGATTQFAAIPLNLLNKPVTASDSPTANYVVSGVWSAKAAEEAAKYLAVNVIATNKHTNHTTQPEPTATAEAVAQPLYTYVCANETVHGVELPPAYLRSLVGSGLLVGDFSSNFCSQRLDVGSFDVVYAGAQKNVGPAGVTIVIVRTALLQPQYASAICPVMLNWAVAAKNDSMYNTPPCQALYMCGLVFQWILKAGGVDAVADVNAAKAALLYRCLDDSALFTCPVAKDVRSRMNVVFTARDKAVEAAFLARCVERNVVGIAGHRMVGGFRASLYNAVSMENVEELVSIIDEFEREYKA